MGKRNSPEFSSTAMKSNFLEGRFKEIARDQWFCLCGGPWVENTSLYILHCKLYETPRHKYLEKSLAVVATLRNMDEVKYLLSSSDRSVMFSTAQLRQSHVAFLECQDSVFMYVLFIVQVKFLSVWFLCIIYVHMFLFG